MSLNDAIDLLTGLSGLGVLSAVVLLATIGVWILARRERRRQQQQYQADQRRRDETIHRDQFRAESHLRLASLQGTGRKGFAAQGDRVAGVVRKDRLN